jgi:uncharacterized protein
MGYRHTPAQLGGACEFCAAPGGARSLAPRHREVGRARLGALDLEARSPRLIIRLLLTGLRFYQACLSPLVPFGCKFYPTCSRYACQAIEVHGARRGVWLAFKRLLRCRPFSPGGYDPVPERDVVLSAERVRL